MATTNKEILLNCRLEYSIPLDLVIDTYAGWRFKGWQVKRGEKALFTTKIWKPCKQKKINENGDIIQTKKLLLVNASFFSREQVEKIAC